MPHQIGSRDVAPDSARRVDALALGAVKRGGMNYLFRDNLVFQDLLVVVDVVDKGVEGVDALLEAAFDPFPFLGPHDPRNQVKGENALGSRRVAIHVEGDPEL